MLNEFYKMEHHKMYKLLNDSTNSKFATRNQIDVNNLSNGQFYVYRNIRFKTPMLRSGFCDYSDEYLVVKRKISLKDTDNANKRNRKLTVKKNAPMRSCI